MTDRPKMRLKEATYKDDGKVQTTLRFGDGSSIVVSAPVSVTVEGEMSDEVRQAVGLLAKELEKTITSRLDHELNAICFEMLTSAFEFVGSGEGEER